MSTSNEHKPADNMTSSPVKNLFRTEQTESSESANETPSAENNTPDRTVISVKSSDVQPEIEYDADKTVKEGGFFDKVKSRFHSFLNVLKQQPEAVDYEDDPEGTWEDDVAAADFGSFKEGYRKEKPGQPQQKEREKANFLKKLRIEHYEEAETVFEPATNEPSPSRPDAAPIEESAAEATQQKAQPDAPSVGFVSPSADTPEEAILDLSIQSGKPDTAAVPVAVETDDEVLELSMQTIKVEKTSVQAEKTLPAQPSVRLTNQPEQIKHTSKPDSTLPEDASEKSTEEPEQTSAQKKADSMEAVPTNVIYSAPVKTEPPAPAVEPSVPAYPKKELPAFDIFAEYAREQQEKTEREQRKKEQELRAEQEKAQRKLHVPEIEVEILGNIKENTEVKAEEAVPVKPSEEKTEEPAAVKPADDKVEEAAVVKPSKEKTEEPAAVKPADDKVEEAAVVKPSEEKTEEPAAVKPTDEKVEKPAAVEHAEIKAEEIKPKAVKPERHTPPAAPVGIPSGRTFSPIVMDFVSKTKSSSDMPKEKEKITPTEQRSPDLPVKAENETKTTAPTAAPVSASESGQQNDSKYSADDLPGGDGITIIPWDVPRKQPEAKYTTAENLIYDAAPEEEAPEQEKDLREGSTTSVTYHYSTAVPFVVMAGKFSRTLRGEYEAVRIFRKTGKISASAPPKPAEKESSIKQTAGAVSAQAKESRHVSQPAVRPTVRTAAPVTVPKPSPSKAGGLAGTAASSVGSQTPQPTVRLTDKSEPEKKQTAEKKPPADKKQKRKPAKSAAKDDKKALISKADKHKAVKDKQSRRKFRFRDLFNGEEEYDPDDDVMNEVQPKPQLDDYNEESDAEAIGTEITTNFQTVFARTIILLVASVASVTLALLAQCTSLFSVAIRNGWLWFAIISFIIFSVAVVASRNPIINGLQPLKRLKGNSDTAVAVASVAAAMQCVTSLFTPDSYLNGSVYLYAPLVIVALFCNSLGKLLIITRTHYNFGFLIKPYPKYAGKIFTDKVNAEKMAAELPTHKAIIGYTKRSKFMSNFLQLSYAPDPSEELAAAIAPWTTAISIICGLLFAVTGGGFLGGLASFALTAFMSVPIICLLAVNIPLRRLCKSVLKRGAMITGYETVKQFCDTNTIMIDSSQLYPKGSVTLSGMKSFKQSKLNDALLSGAAIMYAVNGTMIHIFENIVQCSKDLLPKVENVMYEDGMGLVGWVKGQRVLIGNRELLKAHNIEPPEQEVEERYRSVGNELTYISVGGDLIAMLIITYRTNKYIASELKNLEENGVSFVVRTVDANLTKEMVAENFGLFHRCITILPTGLGNICHEAMTSVEERSRAYLVTRGKLSSFAKAVTGCIKMKSNVTMSRILQCVALVMGLIIVTMISFVSGFEKLGCLEMLIYTGFWSITSIIASLIRK